MTLRKKRGRKDSMKTMENKGHANNISCTHIYKKICNISGDNNAEVLLVSE